MIILNNHFPWKSLKKINQAFNYPIWGDVDNDGDLDIITIMKGFKTVGNTLVYLQWTNIHKIIMEYIVLFFQFTRSKRVY